MNSPDIVLAASKALAIIAPIAVLVFALIRMNRRAAQLRSDMSSLLDQNGWHLRTRQDVAKRPYSIRAIENGNRFVIDGPGLLVSEGQLPAVLPLKTTLSEAYNIRNLLNLAYGQGATK